MRVCIPTTNDAGVAGRVSPHFGRAPYFTLVDLATSETHTFPNPRAEHEEGRCHVSEALEGRIVDAVVCRAMGSIVLRELRDYGVAVLRTDAWTVAGALRQFREGRLSRLTPEFAGRHAHG